MHEATDAKKGVPSCFYCSYHMFHARCARVVNDDFSWFVDHPRLSPALQQSVGTAVEPVDPSCDSSDCTDVKEHDRSKPLRRRAINQPLTCSRVLSDYPLCSSYYPILPIRL